MGKLGRALMHTSNRVAQCGITWVGDKFQDGSNKVKVSLPYDVADKIPSEWYGGDATEMECGNGSDQMNNEDDEDQGRNLKRSRFGQYKSILNLEAFRCKLKPLLDNLIHDKIEAAIQQNNARYKADVKRQLFEESLDVILETLLGKSEAAILIAKVKIADRLSDVFKMLSTGGTRTKERQQTFQVLLAGTLPPHLAQASRRRRS